MGDDAIQRASLRPDEEDFFQLLRRELGVTGFGINLLTLPPGSPAARRPAGLS
jgi:hypothetical protein